MKNKTIINKWDLINVKNCTAKEITSEGKKTTLRMEKNSCKDNYREFLFNTYKPLVQLNMKKKKQTTR